MSLGPVMLDVAGPELTAEDREILQHPEVGGVILFSRNYADTAQLVALVTDIHRLRRPPLLVAVDQEGGRVQRFRDGFTTLPAAHLLGRQYDLEPNAGLRVAERCGWLMAAELTSLGVDLSFAPVVDLDYGVSAVIGNRALHRDAETVARLALAYAGGMRKAGMHAVAKHFPGHGAVSADSHLELPRDSREPAALREDLLPYERMFRKGLDGVMLAHVVYPEVDALPASLSEVWVNGTLRLRLGFDGVVFSDDLSMHALDDYGSVGQRAEVALAAGADMVLVCNDRDAAIGALERVRGKHDPLSKLRLVRLHLHDRVADRAALMRSREYRECRELVSAIDAQPPFELDA